MIKIITSKEEFNEAIKTRVLVDFYAEWCGSCKILGNTLNEINEIDIIKVNTDKFLDLALHFGVMSVPTLIYFENGIEKNKIIGLKTKDEILEIIK